MPSSKDPKSTVLSGSGKLPAGVVPASSLLFPAGGGSGAALSAHINNPYNAHMSGAIGIPSIYPVTSEPLLSSAGGPIDGESVLDFIAQAKDLLPIRPNAIGAAGAGIPNTGVPSWGAIDTSLTGGWKKASNVVFSHYLVANGTANFTVSGVMYPADRGVLAFYKNTDGNFFNSGATTLVAALWLGSNPAPAGIPSANFIQSGRTGAQADYGASLSGLDLFSLTERLPYLKDYSGFGNAYAPYDVNFSAYQLATFGLAAQALSAGDAGSYLLVHWRESFAVTLAAIQPSGLTVGNLVASKAYSGVPSASNFDVGAAANINRHNIYVDAQSASSPSGNTFTTAPVGSPTTFQLSGVPFYSDAGTALNFNVTLAANGLFENSFLTDASPDNVTVPTGFGSASEPIVLDFSDFGGSTLALPYEVLRKQGIAGVYSPTHAPATSDIGEYVNANLAIVSPSSASPVGGAGFLRAQLRTAFQGPVAYVDTNKYLYNSFPQTTSTTTSEPFVDEQYRHISSFTAASGAVPIIPAGGNVFDSTTALAIGGSDLQVIGNQLIYPQTDFSAAAYLPTGGPDYSTFPGADNADHIRRHIRAFNTGIARNTGRIVLSGLVVAALTPDAAYDGSETTGHITGGAIIQVKVPGVTGWLDLGRAKGDPDLGTQDFKGCSTGVTGTTISYDTTSFTVDNGSGVFLIYVRISFLNNVAGLALALDDISWTP